jgi:hypothetical protein
MSGVIFIAAAAATIVVRLTDAAQVEVSDRDVRLSDVAAIAGPNDSDLGNVVLATLAGRSATQEVSRSDLAQLIRRAVPRAEIVGELSGRIRVHAQSAPTSEAASTYSDEPQVRRGDKLTLNAAVGPVDIQREVVALQSASRRHKRVFVRSSEGEVFAAPIEGGAAK